MPKKTADDAEYRSVQYVPNFLDAVPVSLHPLLKDLAPYIVNYVQEGPFFPLEFGLRAVDLDGLPLASLQWFQNKRLILYPNQQTRVVIVLMIVEAGGWTSRLKSRLAQIGRLVLDAAGLYRLLG